MAGFAVIYLAQAIIALLYCERLFVRKPGLPLTAAAFVAGYALLFGVSLLGIPILDVAVFFAVNAVLLYACFGCTVKTAVLHAAFLTLLMAGSETLVLLATRLFGSSFAAYAHNSPITTALTGMSKLLYLTLSFIGARFFTPQKETREEPKLMALFLGLSIFSLLASVLMMYLGTYTEPTDTTESMLLRNIFALLTINLLFLILYSHWQRSQPAPAADLQQESNYYRELQEQYDDQRRLVHDIKNHLHAIGGLAVEENAAEVVSYISELEGGLTPSSPVRLSAEPVLNAILVRFNRDCRDKNIVFTYDLREGGAAFMDAPEVTTLYGNLLTNAIEAAETSAEKAVELSIVHNIAQGVLIVSVNNSCDTPPLRDASGRMLSRKRGGRTPGLGLRNIERVVEKYRGVETMYYDADDRRFHHIIQFPVTQ